jgi:hypothetical protein
LNVPKSVRFGFTVKVFVAESKLMKVGKKAVFYSTTDIDWMQSASKEFITV